MKRNKDGSIDKRTKSGKRVQFNRRLIDSGKDFSAIDSKNKSLNESRKKIVILIKKNQEKNHSFLL